MPGTTKEFWQVASLVIAQTIFTLVLFATLLSILVFVARKPLRKYKPLDMAVFKKLEPYTSNRRNRIILFFTFLGNHKFLIPANLLLIFYFLFIERQSWFSIRVAVIALSSLILMLLLKYLFRRKRPLAPLLNAARGLSFPSGHAIMSVTFYGLLLYIVFHTIDNGFAKYFLSVVIIIVILLIGFSRIYLRVHYTSDVLAGFIIGLGWLLISLSVLGEIEKQKTELAPDLPTGPTTYLRGKIEDSDL